MILKSILNEVKNRTAFTQIWVIEGYYTNTENKRMIEVRKWFGYSLFAYVTFEENVVDPFSSKSVFYEKDQNLSAFRIIQEFLAGIQLEAIELEVRLRYGKAARVIRKKVKQKEWKIPADVKERTHEFVSDLFEKLRMEREMKRGSDSERQPIIGNSYAFKATVL